MSSSHPFLFSWCDPSPLFICPFCPSLIFHPSFNLTESYPTFSLSPSLSILAFPLSPFSNLFSTLFLSSLVFYSVLSFWNSLSLISIYHQNCHHLLHHPLHHQQQPHPHILLLILISHLPPFVHLSFIILFFSFPCPESLHTSSSPTLSLLLDLPSPSPLLWPCWRTCLVGPAPCCPWPWPLWLWPCPSWLSAPPTGVKGLTRWSSLSACLRSRWGTVVRTTVNPTPQVCHLRNCHLCNCDVISCGTLNTPSVTLTYWPTPHCDHMYILLLSSLVSPTDPTSPKLLSKCLDVQGSLNCIHLVQVPI